MTCRHCRKPLRDHQRRKVFPEDGPPGSWHWTYHGCPTGFDADLLAGLAGAGGGA